MKGGSEAPGETPAETIILRYGTNNVNSIDPHHTDEITGEFTMDEDQRQAALAAGTALKEAYNVEFEFISWPTDVRSDIMTSVLAEDPICDIALLWSGSEPTVLGQNVLQNLTPYMDLF